jgi:hypothetical protein
MEGTLLQSIPSTAGPKVAKLNEADKVELVLSKEHLGILFLFLFLFLRNTLYFFSVMSTGYIFLCTSLTLSESFLTLKDSDLI